MAQEDIPGRVSHESWIVPLPQFSVSRSARSVKAVARRLGVMGLMASGSRKGQCLRARGASSAGGPGTRCRREHRARCRLETGLRVVGWPRGRGTVTEAGEAVSAAPRLDLRLVTGPQVCTEPGGFDIWARVGVPRRKAPERAASASAFSSWEASSLFILIVSINNNLELQVFCPHRILGGKLLSSKCRENYHSACLVQALIPISLLGDFQRQIPESPQWSTREPARAMGLEKLGRGPLKRTGCRSTGTSSRTACQSPGSLCDPSTQVPLRLHLQRLLETRLCLSAAPDPQGARLGGPLTPGSLRGALGAAGPPFILLAQRFAV